jgi:hypothetical protein
MILDEEMTKIKVIDLEKLWNFVVYNFFIWNYLVLRNAVWNLISKLLKNSDFSF